MTLKQKIIIAIVAIGIFLIALFMKGLYGQPAFETSNSSSTQNSQVSAQTDPNAVPQLLSTTPENLKNNPVVTPLQEIEISFDQAFENVGEVKHTFEPEMEYEIKLSDNRKTVRFIPKTPYLTGKEYTIVIKSDSKFDDKKTLGRDEVFHFKTVGYSGV